MAYMSQEKKAKLAPQIKAVLAKHKLKGTLSVDGHSTLNLTISQGAIDFIGDWFTHNTDPMKPMADYNRPTEVPKSLSVNTYHIDSHFSPKVAKVLNELKSAMMVGNHDNSDIMSDYFDVGWYINITVGKWSKPYVLSK